MELLNGPEFKDIRTVCHETMNVFGKLFIENAKCVLFMDGVANYQGTLVERLSPNTEDFPARAGRNITPSRPSSSIPPHIHEENHTYEQEPGAKLSATIVGWREVKALTHYGVYVVEVVCSDGRPPKWIYKRFRDFERLFSAYGKLVSSGGKVRLPSTSSSSPAINRDGSVPSASGSKSSSSKGNKFDPSFHEQRAKELQPLLTALCERSDVFGLTKFMRWLFFEKKRDTPLMALFDSALRGTLEVYKITQPVYANNMIDALTWLMFLRISHIWDKLRKGIHFLAVRAVQDLILKALRPLDEMILSLNGTASHIHNILKIQPTLFTKPKAQIDATIRAQFQLTYTAYEAPIRSLLQVISTELTSPLHSIASSISSRFATLSQLIYKNVRFDGDEQSVTALVSETDSFYHTVRSDLVPLLQNALQALNDNISSKFNSAILQSSFSAISRIIPAVPQFVDALLPQQTVLDIFLSILKLRDASDALETELSSSTLTALLNEIETEAERETEALDALFGLRARTYHASVRRIHASCIPLAAPFGDAMLQMGKMWCKYLLKFFRLSSNLLWAQQLSTIPLSWSFSSRDCIELSLRISNDYITKKSLKITTNLISSCILALMEPLTVSTINQVYPAILPAVELDLKRAMITAPPNYNGSYVPSHTQLVVGECPLDEILEAQTYISAVTRQIMKESLETVITAHIISPLKSAWEAGLITSKVKETAEVKSEIEEDIRRRARLDNLMQYLREEIQHWQMRAKSSGYGQLEDRITIPGVMMANNAQQLPQTAAKSTSPRTDLAGVSSPRDIAPKQEPVVPSFSESPVARLIGRVTIEGGDQHSGPSSLDEKKLGKDLTMLSRISEQGGSKADAASKLNRDEPALRFDFDLDRSELTAPVASASNVWAAASASRKLYRHSTRMFYQIPDTPPQTSNLSEAPGLPSSASHTTQVATVLNSDPSSPQRVVPRKPTLTTRPSRPLHSRKVSGEPSPPLVPSSSLSSETGFSTSQKSLIYPETTSDPDPATTKTFKPLHQSPSSSIEIPPLAVPPIAPAQAKLTSPRAPAILMAALNATPPVPLLPTSTGEKSVAVFAPALPMPTNFPSNSSSLFFATAPAPIEPKGQLETPASPTESNPKEVVVSCDQ